MRHGKSLANEQGIIVSHPDIGTSGFGLAEEGKNQVLQSIEEVKSKKMLDSETIIISSDFTRTKETAEIAAKVLGVKDIELNPKLRERFFGNYDKTHHSNYQKVWDEDVKDSSHTIEQVESTEAVVDRTTTLIKELEAKYTGKNILLVSHGDALQILQTAFENVNPSQHRTLLSLRTAEVRRLN